MAGKANLKIVIPVVATNQINLSAEKKKNNQGVCGVIR